MDTGIVAYPAFGPYPYVVLANGDKLELPDESVLLQYDDGDPVKIIRYQHKDGRPKATVIRPL